MIKQWFRTQVKQRFYLFDIEDLQIGARCGVCGKWIPDTIAPIYWAWDICNKCEGGDYA